MRILLPLMFLALVATSASAPAQSTSDEAINKCRKESKDGTRLKCYDNILVVPASPRASQASTSAKPPAGADGPVARYLAAAAETLDLERILGGVPGDSGDGTSAVNQLRPTFDAAYAAAATSVAAQEAIDAHWLVFNRCVSPGDASRFEKRRLSAACTGELAGAKAKVELAWTRRPQ